MKKVFLLLLFFLALLFLAQAQKVVVEPSVDSTYEDEDVSTSEEHENTNDTAIIMDYWQYPADSIYSLRKQKDFRYAKNLDSLLRKWQEQQMKGTKKVKTVNISPVFTVFRIIIWIIAISVIVFIIYRLFLSEHGLFTSPTKNKQLEIEEEPVTDIKYLDRQLNEAVNVGNYRLAVRYMYLQVLSVISEKGWIILSPDKTNYQYVRELAKPQLKNDFSRITMNYDYIWYGDFVIEKTVFTAVKEEFDEFQLKIRQS